MTVYGRWSYLFTLLSIYHKINFSIKMFIISTNKDSLSLMKNNLFEKIIRPENLLTVKTAISIFQKAPFFTFVFMYFPLQLKQNFLSSFPSGSKALAFEIEKKVSSIRKRWQGNQIYKFVWSPKSKTNFLKWVCVLTDYILYPTIER